MVIDFLILPDNPKFLAKFHFGTLRIIDPMSQCRFFHLLLEHQSEFVLKFS